MAIVVFLLGLCFAAMGAISLFFGYDLGGTERGVAYTISGSVALSAAGLLFGIATVTARLSALVKLLRERGEELLPVALPGMASPPPYVEPSRPVVPVQRPEAPPPASQPATPAAMPSLAPALAGGAAAVATAATMDMVFRKEPASKAEAEIPASVEDKQEPAFDFEQELARELARPQPELSPLPSVVEPAIAETPAALSDPELWDVKVKPEAETAKPADAIDHPEHGEIPDLDTGKPHPAVKLDEAEKPATVAHSDDWLTTPKPTLREEEPKSLPSDLPDDVFDDVFDEEPAPAEAAKAEPALEKAEEKPHQDEKAEEAREEPAHPESSVLHSPEPEPEPESKPVAQKPAQPSRPLPMPATATPDDPSRKVIGSYSVGTNNYTMYADGSVEAHTETGLYRFASLDELRHFIEKGATTAAE